MHELSIALNLVEIAEVEARHRGLSGIRSLHVQLGTLSGVVKEALLSAFDFARQGSLVENAILIVEEVPIVIYCPKCAGESATDAAAPLCCSRCGTLSGEILRGRELDLVSLEVDA